MVGMVVVVGVVVLVVVGTRAVVSCRYTCVNSADIPFRSIAGRITFALRSAGVHVHLRRGVGRRPVRRVRLHRRPTGHALCAVRQPLLGAVRCVRRPKHVRGWQVRRDAAAVRRSVLSVRQRRGPARPLRG